LVKTNTFIVNKLLQNYLKLNSGNGDGFTG